MIQVDIPAAVRSTSGKGSNRQLRFDNKTPAVVYSDGNDAVSLQIDAKELYKTLLFIHGRNAVVTLSVDGDSVEKRHVLIKEIQKDPVTDMPVHLDFLEISLDTPIQVKVPINYSGTAKGVDLGGELHIFKKSINLKGKPLDLPDVVEADISPLDRGDAGITFNDLNVPEGVDLVENAEAVCVSVS